MINTVGCIITIGVCELGIPTIKRDSPQLSSQSVVEQIDNLIKRMENSANEKRGTTLSDAQQYLVLCAQRIMNLFELISAPIGLSIYQALSNDTTSITWLTLFANATSQTSELGTYLSTNETDMLMSFAPSVIPSANISESLARYNRTLTYWNSGILTASDLTGSMNPDFLDYNVQNARLQQLQSDITATQQEGFNSFGDAFDYAYSNWQTVSQQKLAGICAQVVVQLDQELVVQRQAFLATLQISNTGSAPLTNIQVQLSVTKSGSASINDSYNLFAIGSATNTAITGSVDLGTGGLAGNGQGSAQWIILPTKYAAPVNATYYDIGGILTYTLDGVQLTVNLYPGLKLIILILGISTNFTKKKN